MSTRDLPGHPDPQGTRLVRPGDGGWIATLWEEAQKSLAITAALEERGVVRLRGVHYVRELEGRGLRQRAVHLYRSFSSSTMDPNP